MISLAHGLPEEEHSSAPFLEVGVRTQVSSIDIRDTLTEAVIAGSFLPSVGTFDAWRQKSLPSSRAWSSTVSIPISGRETEFDVSDLGSHWVAVKELGSEWLYIHARRIPRAEVRLEPVDIEKYLAGSHLYART
jgi:hypothetical protein